MNHVLLTSDGAIALVRTEIRKQYETLVMT